MHRGRGGNRAPRAPVPVAQPLQQGEIVILNKVELKGIPIKDTMGPINTLLIQTQVSDKAKDFGWFTDHTKEGISRQAIYKDNLIGVVMVKEEKNKKNGKYLFISAITTHPFVRGQHIGSMLMNHVTDIYKQNKKQYSSIRLHVDTGNLTAIAFYGHKGFRQGELLTYLNPQAHEFIYE